MADVQVIHTETQRQRARQDAKGPAEEQPWDHTDELSNGDDESNLAKDGTETVVVFSSWRSNPPPPESLWETSDVQYLDKVRVHILVQLQCLSPKDGSYSGRMKCHWQFRTLNAKDRTTPRLIVPGIRMPRLTTTVEESRAWRHMESEGMESTIAWSGVTVMGFTGNEIFEVHDFPFDRQVLELNIVECVWRETKGTDEYFEGMKIVEFTVETISTLPEWDTFSAVIEPLNVVKLETGPTYCTRFNVKLRLQRKEGYYVVQIFMVSTLITVASLIPLALAPGDTHVGDRLALHSGGLLTLVSFKYSISGEMPAVPYNTFVSKYLTLQIITLVTVAAESIAAYKLVDGEYVSVIVLNILEDLLLYSILMYWLGYFLYVAFLKKRTPWDVVLSSQATTEESHDKNDLSCPPMTSETTMTSTMTEVAHAKGTASIRWSNSMAAS